MNKLGKVAIIGAVSCIGAQFFFDLGKASAINAMRYLSPEIHKCILERIKNVADGYRYGTIAKLQAEFIYYAAIAQELAGL